MKIPKLKFAVFLESRMSEQYKKWIRRI